MDQPPEPISEDDLLYRRIPVATGNFDPPTGLSPKAFRPNKQDDTGLSLDRATNAASAAALGRKGKSYYIAVVRAKDVLRKTRIVATPKRGRPGHVELPDLRYDNRREDWAEECQVHLKDICISVEGPFPGKFEDRVDESPR